MAINTRSQFGQQYYRELSKIAQGQQDTDSENFFRKSLTFEGAGSGAEFVPTKTAADIITFVYENAWARQTFGTYVMDKLKEDLPKFTNGAEVKYLPVSITSVDPTNQIPESTQPDTGVVSIELKTLAINLQVNNKFVAYNANPQIEQILQEELSNAISFAEGDAIINGDTASTHQDADVTGAGDYRKAFDGMRKKALANPTAYDFDGAVATTALFRRLIRLLGKYGRGQRQDLVFLIPPSVEEEVLGFKALETLDKYGAGATIITGEIGRLYGGSVVVTENIREDLDDSGVRGAEAGTLTVVLACNRRHSLIGVPRDTSRALSIKAKEEIEFDRVRMVAIEDFVWFSRHDDSIAIAYNVGTEAAPESP